MPIRSVVIDHTDNSTIYLGAEIGVYKKNMMDDSWELYNENLPNTTVMELEVVYGTNTLRGTTWEEVYRNIPYQTEKIILQS